MEEKKTRLAPIIVNSAFQLNGRKVQGIQKKCVFSKNVQYFAISPGLQWIGKKTLFNEHPVSYQTEKDDTQYFVAEENSIIVFLPLR